MVEDSATDAFVIEESLRMSGVEFAVRGMRDGESALASMDAVDADDSSPLPDLVLLDLNLPRIPGLQVLAAFRRSRRMQSVPVIVVTSSDYRGDRDAAAEGGANEYFCKPHDLDEFLLLGELVRKVLA